MQKHLTYGEFAPANPLLDEIIRGATNINHAPTLLGGLAWRSTALFFPSEYEQAAELLVKARRLASELHDGFMLLFCLFLEGMVVGDFGAHVRRAPDPQRGDRPGTSQRRSLLAAPLA